MCRSTIKVVFEMPNESLVHKAMPVPHRLQMSMKTHNSKF